MKQSDNFDDYGPTSKLLRRDLKKIPASNRNNNGRPIPKTTTTTTATRSLSSNNRSDNDPVDDQDLKTEEIGRPIIKSPLDAHGYKVVRYPKNGLKALLVSTCDHSQKNKGQPSRKTCVFEKISEFNETHVNFKSTPGANGKDVQKDSRDKENHKFTKASKQQAKESRNKRNKVNSAPKCKTGNHEADDEMQTFCNTMFACVLYIKVGSHQDPRHLQGMAHLCEHVMSLGSENYPEPESFSKLCEEDGGGFSNAETQPDNTLYYFFINHELIVDALDMFGDMFAHPVFRKPEVDKEIENLNSEFEQKKWIEELHRIAILRSCIQDENHPVNSFGWGTKESLKLKGGTKELMKEIHTWIKTYYFSDNMFFALQGPLPLPELEKLFANFAKKIPGKKEGCIITRPLSSGDAQVELPFDMAKWNQLYYMDVPQSTTFMSVSWALDPKFGKNFETKPLNYFRYILSHKEPGSLDWYLKQKGWIFAMYVNTPESSFLYSDYYTIFSLYLELKSDGLAKRMEVLKTVFQYIKLLQENKASEEIFNEFRQLRADTFHYRSDNNICDPTIGRVFDRFYATETLRSLLHVLSKTGTTEDLLLSTFLTRKFDAQLLDEFANCLQPSKALVIFGDHSFAEGATETDKWFPSKYFSRPMTPELVAELQNQPPIEGLSFPKQNPYLLVSFCYPDEHSSKDKMEKKDDLLAYQSDKGEVIYGNSKCQKGILPSAQYIIEFSSPALEDDAELMTAPCMDVFVLLLHDVLDVKLGRALSSLISYDTEYDTGTIRVLLYGPSPKLPRLAQSILNTVENFDEEVKHHSKAFEDCKRMQVGYYKSDLDEGESCSSKLLEYVIVPRLYFTSDFVAILEDSLDIDDFLAFVSDFKRRMYLVGDLNGCVSKSHADDLAQLVDSFQCKPYKKKMEHQILQHAIQLPLGERCLRVLAKNRKDKNSTVRNYYQFRHLGKEEKNMFHAIAMSLNMCAFEELRTKQGLGYNPEAGSSTFGGVPGIYVFIQGVADEHTCGFIDEKMDEFLQIAFDNNLSTQKDFEEKVLIWLDNDIKLNYKETKQFYKDHLLPTGHSFRKLSVQVQGHPKPKSEPKLAEDLDEKIKKYSSGEKLERCSNGLTCGLSKYTTYIDMDFRGVKEENGYFITDVKKFKDGRPCFPVFDSVDTSDDDDE